MIFHLQTINQPPKSDCEAIGGGGIEELVVFVPVAVLEQDQVVVVHHLLAEHHGQELVVGEVLHQGGNDMPRLLNIFIICRPRLSFTETRSTFFNMIIRGQS